MIANKTVQRRNPANTGTGEDVLKTSLIFVFRSHPQDVFKTCWSKSLVKTFSTKLNWPYKHVFKITSRHLYGIFKTVSRYLLLYIFRGLLLDAFKTSCSRHHIQDLFKMSSKHITHGQLVLLTHLRQVFKTSEQFFRIIYAMNASTN